MRTLAKSRLELATKSDGNRLGRVARFYLHLINDMDVPDEEGKELPDLNAARNWASRQARLLLGEIAKEEGRVVLHHRIDIENEHGEVLETVRFGDVVKVER